MPKPGHLFIISGPSGVGKGTLVDAVLQRLANIEVSVSATTRQPRKGDVQNRTYHFFSEQEFDQAVADDGFLEWALVHGKRYGTLWAEVNRILGAGHDLILEIDVQGNNTVKAKLPEAVSIFVAPPSMTELATRLQNRQTEDEAKIKQRLETAKLEMQGKDGYNVVIVNKDLDAAIEQLVNLISSYRAQ